MKKYLFMLLVLLIPTYVLAKNDNSQQGQGDQSANSQGQGNGSSSQPGQGVGYENKIQTQNQGEDQQLQVSNQQESMGPNANASEVAKYVHELLNMPDRNGGIGQQVKEIAQAQNQSQQKIQEKIQTMEQKGKLSRFIFGPNSDAINELKEERVMTQERLQTFKELKSDMLNTVDQETLQSLIDALSAQDTELAQEIMDQESAFSLIGWIKNLLK